MTRLIALLLPENERTAPANLAVVAFAQQYAHTLDARFDLLIAGGPKSADFAQKCLHFGAENILVASQHDLAHPSPQAIAKLSASALSTEPGASLTGPATGFGFETLAGVAGLLDLPMLPPIFALEEIDGQISLHARQEGKRQVLRVDAERAVFPIDQMAFGAARTIAKASPIQPLSIAPDQPDAGVAWIEDLPASGQSYDLSKARVIVAGGRALHDAESFERLIGGLARKLDGVAGASGAAVHAGFAPIEMLIGQTGRTVTPDLYIAAGISGSDQHTGGMGKSRVIVAINSNPNAAIFRMADYGLVADVHQALPELIEKI